MGCLDANAVLATFDERLSPDERAAIDEHLATCAMCRKLVASYAAMLAPVAEEQRGETVELPEPVLEAKSVRRDVAAQAKRRVGELLSGRWRIDRLIAVGGMAQVFAATHRNGRQVAVKILRPELATDEDLVQRFLREGYVANKVGHPAAVVILDDDVAPDGAPFLVMELLAGRTLKERLDATGPLGVGEALGIVEALLDVLAAAHDKGIVHRDVKPENVIQLEDGAIKMLDFGIARLRERREGAGHTTQSGTTMGTLGYMPPEQARGQVEAVDARSDVWAVGATLYTLVSGRVLHAAPTPSEALVAAMTEPVPAAATLLPYVSSSVWAVLDRALAFAPGARFADASEMREAVRAARAELAGPGRASAGGTAILPAPRAAPVEDEAPPAIPMRASGARWPALLAAAACVLLVGALIWGAKQAAEPEGTPRAEGTAAPVASAPIVPAAEEGVVVPAAPPSAIAATPASAATSRDRRAPTVLPSASAASSVPAAAASPAHAPAPAPDPLGSRH